MHHGDNFNPAVSSMKQRQQGFWFNTRARRNFPSGRFFITDIYML
jgi:hypothetical protein